MSSLLFLLFCFLLFFPFLVGYIFLGTVHSNHGYIFTGIYCPGSPLEAEVSAARRASGAHQLAYWEAAYHARTMMHRYINLEQVYMLAAMQLQANEGNLSATPVNLATSPNALSALLQDATLRSKVSENVIQYIHADLQARNPLSVIVDGVLSKWLEFQGLDRFQSQTVFLGYVQQSPLYGSEMLQVGVRQKKESSGEDAKREPFRSDMSGTVNFAISHFGVRLFPHDEGNGGNHGNLTIWEHSLSDISEWVTSDSGDYFAYIVEQTRVYVKCPYSQRIQELFEEYLNFHEKTQNNKSHLLSSVIKSEETSNMLASGVSAPHIRRSSVVRLRDLTHERAFLAAEVEEEKRDGSAGDLLRDGWEEFYSEDHQKFYYFNARTNSTTWDRVEAYHRNAPNSPKKSMIEIASLSAAR